MKITSAGVAHQVKRRKNNRLFKSANLTQDKTRWEHLTQQHVYNRCHVTTAPKNTRKSSMTSIAHRGG